MAKKKERSPLMAYHDTEFLNRGAGRPLRILSEYLEPVDRLNRTNIADTIVFMGSARLVPREQAERELKAAKGTKATARAEMQLHMSQFYEATSDLAARLTSWSKELKDDEHRYVICTGGGPGIMEAANRGASRAKGINMGMSISIPDEQSFNRYITRELTFHFHYFFMRKFWLAYLAKAVIFMPGGYGTLDELFELLTLLKTKKIQKHLPIVLFSREYWDDVVDFDALVRYGTIDAADRDLFIVTDSVDEAFEYVTGQLRQVAPVEKGASL
ncbi:MAG: LOG family protein [Thermoleophilia bacterium]